MRLALAPTLVARLAGLALLAGLVSAGAGCPLDPPPPPPPPVAISARVADGAPAPDPKAAPDVVLPRDVPPGVAVVDVGLVALTGGVSSDILVDVRDLGAMTVLVYGHDGTRVILERAVDPDGDVVVSDVAPADVPLDHLRFARGFPAQLLSKNRVLASATSGAFLLPNTPEVAPRDGTWTLRVSAWRVDEEVTPPARAPDERPVHVVLVARGEDTGQGRLDLNLRFAGAALDAGAARDDPGVQGALDVVREALAGAAIELGEVRYLDHPAGFEVLELDAPCEGADLFSLASSLRDDPAGAAAGPGADVFFVDGFICVLSGGVDVGAAIEGLSAGLPGPPFVRGTPHGAVAVAARLGGEGGAGDDEVRALGVVMAHELAHYLGLYHTREASFASADPLFDAIADSPDGSDADDNLMYFAAFDDVTLSEGQARVLRTSPLVRAD